MARTLRRLADIAVTEISGVGERRARALEQLGITSVLDLVTHYPRRYLDRTREARLTDLVEGDEATVLVEVRRVSSRRTRQGRALVLVEVGDGRDRLSLTFFNQAWRERQLAPGTQVLVFGKVERFRGTLQMTNPVVDLVGDRTRRIVPVYPQSDSAGVTSWDLAGWIAEALRRSREFADPVPADVLARHDLVDRTAALTRIHQPETMADATVARRRLVFDELLRVQLALVRRKRRLEAAGGGVAHPIDRLELVDRFLGALPFPLTGAQTRVIDEIVADLGRPAPMHRLLQGDVGAGKTIVAVATLLVAVGGGRQGALMAPTAVLAEQHHLAVRRLVEGLEVDDPGTLTGRRPVAVGLLTNRVAAAERRRLLAELATGGLDLVVGTHALIQEAVEFRALGAVVIDEQHRFGVEQRAALRAADAEGHHPDVLVMTATPIPRTAAMTVYGDLDVSVLDELPPGRTPIETSWVTPGGDDEAEVWARVRDQVAEGRQAYVVCPLVEDSEKLEIASAEATFERLRADELAGLRLGLLHGRVSTAETEQTMDLFRRGALDVLVATTVIEVGVDVPNATVMVVLDADRFGIAQLHQLRGRVGRGAARSWCHLVAEGATPDAVARLEALVATTDGFVLAETDLDLRGEGTLLGERQTGRNDLRLASLRRDREWVAIARAEAVAIVDADPELATHPVLADEIELLLGDDEAAEFLQKS